MITFSNLSVAESLTFTLPARAAAGLLCALADAAREIALGRWEQELAAWLADRRWAIASELSAGIDVGEVAWTPDHFLEQQRFVLATCERAQVRCGDAAAHATLAQLRALFTAHSRAQVLVGRRWRWLGSRPELPSGSFPAPRYTHKR